MAYILETVASQYLATNGNTALSNVDVAQAAFEQADAALTYALGMSYTTTYLAALTATRATTLTAFKALVAALV